jgi:hypothetical protein
MVYEGDWMRGVREGHGKISYKDGSFYRGHMQNNQVNSIKRQIYSRRIVLKDSNTVG